MVDDLRVLSSDVGCLADVGFEVVELFDFRPVDDRVVGDELLSTQVLPLADTDAVGGHSRDLGGVELGVPGNIIIITEQEIRLVDTVDHPVTRKAVPGKRCKRWEEVEGREYGV